MNDTINEGEKELMEAFAKVLSREEILREAEAKLKEATTELSRLVNHAEIDLKQAWEEVDNFLRENGVTETIIPGRHMDYKVSYGTPRESVKVIDPEAVPDEFVKLERKPKLKEIGEMLKKLRESGQALPNWATFQWGERKLGWKAVKRGK